MTTHPKGRAPRLTCAICGGPVAELSLLYRCVREGTAWPKSETGLLVRHYDRSKWRRVRYRKTGKFLSTEVSR